MATPIFTRIVDNYTTSIPPTLVLAMGTGSFFLILDTTNWEFPTFVNWTIEVVSSDVIEVIPDPWSNLISLNYLQASYEHRNLDVMKNYYYRYSITTKAATSPRSGVTAAGKPKIVIQNSDGTYSISEFTG